MAAKKHFYPCPNADCKKEILVYIPGKNDVSKEKPYWDSATVCPHCGVMHFKRAYPSGKVTAEIIDSIRQEEKRKPGPIIKNGIYMSEAGLLLVIANGKCDQKKRTFQGTVVHREYAKDDHGTFYPDLNMDKFVVITALSNFINTVVNLKLRASRTPYGKGKVHIRSKKDFDPHTAKIILKLLKPAVQAKRSITKPKIKK